MLSTDLSQSRSLVQDWDRGMLAAFDISVCLLLNTNVLSAAELRKRTPKCLEFRALLEFYVVWARGFNMVILDLHLGLLLIIVCPRP